MEANQPEVVIEGIEVIIERDLAKHKVLCEVAHNELAGFRTATSHEVKQKRYYKTLIGGGKFNDDSLRDSIDRINVNITHFQNKCRASEESIKHHTLIVDTLTEQLKEQNGKLKKLQEYRKNNE